MDGSCFDALTRTFASGSRRRFLAGLAGAVAGAMVGRGSVAVSCRAPGQICREHADCCWHDCGAKDATGHRRCICPPGLIACGHTCVDPLADPANCGSCGHVCPSVPCQAAICSGGACDTLPDPTQNGALCDDGDLCKVGDHCMNGACTGTPVDCSGLSDACHVGFCDPSNGSCQAQTLADDTPCVHPSQCAVNPTCQGGVCTPELQVICFECSPCSGGACAPLPDGTPCSGGGVCVNGLCQVILCAECNHLVGIQCVAEVDGTPCSSGVCSGGLCVQILCSNCEDLVGVQCVPKADNTPCGQNGEICLNGICLKPI